MNPRTRLVLAVIAIPLLGISGCLKLERPRPERRFYLIEAARPDQPRPPVAGPLQVRRFQVSPAFDSPGFIYRTGEHGYESDYYNAFFVPPAAMFTEQCTRWLGDAGLFERVAPAASQLRGQFLLEGHVSAVYGDYRQSGRPEAVIELQLLLLRDRPGDPEVIHQGNYLARQPVGENTPEGLVAAWNAALASILARVEGDFASILTDARSPGSG
jgi:cholesterol transport system auxiliary component